MKQKHLAFISIIFAAIIGGAIPVFGKIGLRQIPPFTFTFLRFLIASIFLIPFVIREGPKIGKDIWKIVVLSLLATANVTFFAFGVRLTTATSSQLLYAVVPVFAAIFSYYFLKEHVTRRKITGIAVGFLGVIFIVILPELSRGTAFQGNLIGNLIILIGVVTFSLYTVFSKRYQVKYSPIILTFVFAITTTLSMAVFAGQEYFANPSWVNHVSLISILSILYVGIFGGTIYYLLYQYAIKHGTPIAASMTLFLQPLATFSWAVVFLSEKLTLGIAIGAFLALFGAYIVSINPRR